MVLSIPLKVRTPGIVIAGSDKIPIPVILKTPYILKKSLKPVISVSNSDVSPTG
jgi:hypothetical protein